MSLFQSEAEQIQKIDAAAENAAKEAESEKPSAFVISEDEIDRMLRTGSNFEGGKIRIYALYQQQGDAKERAAFLKAEYGLGGHSYTFMDGSRGFADYNGRGILLRNYDHDREVRLTWSAVDKRLDRLVENDQYLTALESIGSWSRNTARRFLCRLPPMCFRQRHRNATIPEMSMWTTC